MKCQMCRAENPDGIDKCAVCGAILTPEALKKEREAAAAAEAAVAKKNQQRNAQGAFAPRKKVLASRGAASVAVAKEEHDPLAGMGQLASQLKGMTPEQAEQRDWSYKIGLFYVIIGMSLIVIVLAVFREYIPWLSLR